MAGDEDRGAETAGEAERARREAEQARDDAARQAARAEQAEQRAELAAPPHDPVLDTGARRIEAGVDEDNPFGQRGEPLSEQSPFRIAFVATMGVAVAALLVDSVIIARQVLILILVAAFLAIGLDPAVRWLAAHGLKRGLAVLVIVLAALGFFGGFVAAVAPPIATQSTALVQKAPDYADRLTKNKTIKKLDNRYHFVEKLKEKAKSGVSINAFGGILGVGRAILGFAVSTLTVIILMIYFLANMPAIKRTMYRSVPRTRRARVGLLGDEILNRVGGYVLGNLFTSLVAGVATLIWLEAWGVPYAVALSMFVAITDLIPLIGATIGAIAVTAVALFQGIPTGIATFAYYMGYQQFENYVLQPRVMKRTVDVAPVVTIVAALLGAALLGVLGALIAVPIAAGIQLLLTEVAFPRQDAA
ncbi:MAG TPA: AI-2E family transporter [Mycobacteriales bacterium]|nr:AI-2E family transporter [Mycobacteriales bacterium]